MNLGKANFVLLMCWFAWISNYINRMILPPLLPLMIPDLGLSLTEAGLLMSVFMFGYSAMQLPSGILSDRFGKKRILVLGMIGYSTATLLSGVSTSFQQLLAFRVLTGLFQGTHLSVANSLLSDLFPSDRRGRAIGIHESGPNVGATLAMPFATLVATATGWRHVFILASLIGFAMAISFFVLVPEAGSTPHDLTQKASRKPGTLAQWKPLLPFIVAFSGYTFSNWALYTFIPTYLSRKGITLVTVGLLFAILPFVGIFSKIFGGTISDKVGRAKVIVSALASLGVLMYLLTIVKAPAEIVIILGCLGFVLFSFSPVIYAKVSELYGTSKRSSAIGMVSTIGNLVGAVSPAAVGFVADRADFETSYYMITGVVLACALLGAFLMRKQTMNNATD